MQEYLVISIHRGYTRLVYGPGLFLKAMEQLLQGIPGLVDDILISGLTELDCLSSLEEVLKRLAKAGQKAQMSLSWVM